MTSVPPSSFLPFYRLLQRFSFLAGFTITSSVAAGVMEAGGIVSLMPAIRYLSGQANSADAYSIPLIDASFSAGEMFLIGLSAFALCASGSALLHFVNENALAHLEFRISQYCMQSTIRTTLRSSWQTLLQLQAGEIQQSVLYEALRIGLAARFMVIALSQFLVVGVLLFTCIIISFPLTVACTSLAVLGALLSWFMGKKIDATTLTLQQNHHRIARHIEQTFGALKFFKLMSLTSKVEALLFSEFSERASSAIKVQRLQSFIRLLVELAVALLLAGILYVGFSLFTLTLETLVVFIAIFYRLVPRLLGANSIIVQARAEIHHGCTWESRLRLAGQNPEFPGGEPLREGFRSIRLDNVSFAPAERAQPVLKNVSLDIQRHELVAVVGPSGAGKTTTLDVICGLVVPTLGEVFINDSRLVNINKDSWRVRIGIVQQESPILSNTVRENITIGFDSVDEDQLNAAIAQSHSLDLVSSLPQGLNTYIGAGGVPISAGQAQRLAIARALYRKPELLILDEATSALDAVSEERLLNTIQALKGTVTILMISHRISSVRFADKIIVLDRGQVVQRGSWNDLIQDPAGLFHKLATLQGAV